MSKNNESSGWNFSFYKNLDNKNAHPPKQNQAPAQSKGFFDSIKSGTTGMFQSASETAQASYNYAMYMPYIIGLAAVGAFFLTISFMFLPMVLLKPHKFSLSFAVACACFLGAISLLKGNPKTFFLSFLGPELNLP